MISTADVVVLVTEKNLETLKVAVPYVKTNISKGKIYVAASKKLKESIEKIDGVIFADEDEIVEGMTFSSVAEIMEKAIGSRKRTGWYFQQFIKLGWAKICKDKNYIVVDSDTLFLNEITFVDENGCYEFTQKKEYNKPYFDTLEKLFDGELVRQGDFSFVAEHMIFDCDIVNEMLSDIMKRHPERGSTFYEIIINSVNKEDLPRSGFSEFETYGTYIMTKYPDKVKLRTLRTFRESALILGGKPTQEQLDWAANDYDIISLELPNYKSGLTKLTSLEITRKAVRLKTIADARKKVRSIYRRILGKKDLIFD